MVPIFSAALQDVDPGHAGSASGILNAVQQVGAAVGIAIIGVIFFGQLNHGAYRSFDDVSSSLRQDLIAQHVPAEATEQIINQTRACFHDRSTQKDANAVPASCQQAQATAPAGPAGQKIGQIIANSARDANARNFASSFRSAVIYVILLLVVVCGLSFMLPKKFKMAEEGMAA